MVDPTAIFIDGTHIKASANKKKHMKKQVAKTAKIYAEQLLSEVNAEREKLSKKPIEANTEQEMTERTVSTTDPDAGMFVKGEHERQFAYEAHTASDSKGFVVGVEVTAGNIHDSVAWDGVYDEAIKKLEGAEFVVMDAAYKTPWIAEKILDGNKVPILPYTRYKGNKDGFKPWDFEYDEGNDCIICPQGQILRHTTTDRDGKRIYRSTPKNCKACPCREKCGANEKGQKLLTRHIWQEHLDLVEQLRKNERGKELYAQRKETIERVFADSKEKHAMRYTHHRGLTRVANWVKLKYAAMNLKKLARWSAKSALYDPLFRLFACLQAKTPFRILKTVVF